MEVVRLPKKLGFSGRKALLSELIFCGFYRILAKLVVPHHRTRQQNLVAETTLVEQHAAAGDFQTHQSARYTSDVYIY